MPAAWAASAARAALPPGPAARDIASGGAGGAGGQRRPRRIGRAPVRAPPSSTAGPSAAARAARAAAGASGALPAVGNNQLSPMAAAEPAVAWAAQAAAGISTSGVTIINSGTITGGNGGTGGSGGTGGAATAGNRLLSPAGGNGGVGGDGGAGAAAISGSNLTVINSGTISPRPRRHGGRRRRRGDCRRSRRHSHPRHRRRQPAATGPDASAAIVFTGGVNVLELQQGSTITGNVVAARRRQRHAAAGRQRRRHLRCLPDRRQRAVPELRHPREDRQQQLDGDRRAGLHRRRHRHERDDDADGNADFSLANRVTVNGTLDISGNGGTFIATLAGSGTVVMGNASNALADLQRLDRVFRRHQRRRQFRRPDTRRRHADLVGGQHLQQRHADRRRRHPGAEGQRLDRQFRLRGPRRCQRHARHLADQLGHLASAALFGTGRVSLGSKTLTITSGSFFNGVIQDGGIAGGTGGGVTIAAAVRSGRTCAASTPTPARPRSWPAAAHFVEQRQHRPVERGHPGRRGRAVRHLGGQRRRAPSRTCAASPGRRSSSATMR